MEQRLACGHTVDVTVGTRLYTHYDVSFGVVESDSANGNGTPWFDLRMDGSPFKAAGSLGMYDADRLTCIKCGQDELRLRHRDPLVCTKDWELVR